jgi:hypothetical protein
MTPPTLPDTSGFAGHWILALLRQAGTAGVSRSDLIFQHRFAQCGTRIFELEQMGHQIHHELKTGQRYVTYYLESEATKEKSLPTFQPKRADPRHRTFANSPDWYEREAGKPRPAPRPIAEDLPQFNQP